MRHPQFQKGRPPSDTEGLFVLGEEGLPLVQREQGAPVVITIPKQPMSPSGYPLWAWIFLV